MKIPVKSYGVDVANYQGNSVNYSGAKFAIVKTSEGTGYRNPKASAQIKSAKSSKMLPMSYHFALFGANASQAQKEAKFAVSEAKRIGVPAGSYIACDWETGDGNNVNGGAGASANAVIAFMKVVKANGYKPLLYSGASILRNNIDSGKVVKTFGNCLWVASYATMGRIDTPNFGYFPSMNGVAIWQFTDNWKGLTVDGNINLLPLSDDGAKASTKPKSTAKKTSDAPLNIHPVVKWDVERVFVVSNKKGAYVYTDKTLTKQTTLKDYNTVWQVFGEEDGAIRVGKGQYFDGRAGFTKSNPIAHNNKKHAVVKIINAHTHALDKPSATDSKPMYKLPINTKYEIVGREGRFLQLKTKDGSKRYVTGNHAYIVL